MAFVVSKLWEAPKVNPVSMKAQSIPLLNPFNTYGRVFILSWWGFFVAFWSWYAFPPLLIRTIKGDLHLTSNDVQNSNIVSLVATAVVRVFAGSACDKFGARWTLAGLLLIGAIPTALAGTANGASSLIAIRFFVGILGGTFVPCQVWTSAFFDKNVVGTATSLTAGLGNAGGGVTYFLMPAIFSALVRNNHMRPHVAWRVSFVIPLVFIVVSALMIVLLCPDTPTGPWSSRQLDIQRHIDQRDTFFDSVGHEGKRTNSDVDSETSGVLTSDTMQLSRNREQPTKQKQETHEDDLLAAASWELVERPSFENTTKVALSLSTLTLVLAYFATFGTELSVNSILGSYYDKNFPTLGETGSGKWAAMFGLLNIVFRPIGGLLSDLAYRRTRSLWAKKILLIFLGLTTGAFLLAVGITDPHSKANMMGLMTGLAFFEEAANGACFSLVPHVHPASTGKILLHLSRGIRLADGCHRIHHWSHRCRWQSRWNCLYPSIKVQRNVVRKVYVDYGDCCYCFERTSVLDSTNPKRTAGRKMNVMLSRM